MIKIFKGQKMKKINFSKLYQSILYIYIFLPIIIFVAGWLKWYYSIPVCALILFSLIKAISEETLQADFLFQKSNWSKLIGALFIISFWVFISGIGGLCYQNSDHEIRNTLYRALVEYDWPVISLDGSRGLIYYIGFWLPSALFGKIFGYKSGLGFQDVWAVLGIFIVYSLICLKRNKVDFWSLAILILFSGLDYLGVWLLQKDGIDLLTATHIEWWAFDFQYSSNTTQLFWVFNQAIPAWVVTSLLYVNENKRNMLFILSGILFTSTFPFVGLLPFVIYWLLKDFKLNKNFFKQIFTIQNCVGVFVIGIVSLLYLIGNVSAGKVSSDSVSNILIDPSVVLLKYLLFCLFEFGIYLFVIAKYEKKNILFWICCAVLLICPWIKVGGAHDFCMRASIPALFILMFLVIKAIDCAMEKKDKFFLICITCVLLIGAITPFNEIHRSIRESISYMDQGISVKYPEVSIEDDLFQIDNFSGSTKSNLFFKYFAK